MNNKNGGPAFPIGSGDMRDPCGMTLRDYFAAKAMQGFASQEGWQFSHLAESAYQLADAMLLAREKTNECD